MRYSVFISHRSSNKAVADMLKDFLVTTGIPNNKIFCSSLPGNDIERQISSEVKKQLQVSAVNILILSKEYYESAYCLNEAGIVWFLEDEVSSIAIGLPEIDESNMWGFYNGENKIRRLNNENDVAAIYDIVRKRMNVPNEDFSVVTRERQKLSERYEQYLRERELVDKTDSGDIVVGRYMEGYHTPVIGEHDVGNIPVDSAFLLVYASVGNGEIIRTQTIDSVDISVDGYQFQADDSYRESARWQEALHRLINWGWVKSVNSDGTVYKLTGIGYSKADWLKEAMDINTENEPINELKEFET